MQTLEQLKSGQLAGATELTLRENLSTFPQQIFDLAETLEVLDLSGNQLSTLPDDLQRLKKLRILFLSNNQFTEVPTALAQCPVLEMIGFKSNQISTVAENALPIQTRWLILTDNQIDQLPDSMGKLYRLQKMGLAGNRLTSIPASMADCHSLELARLSANKLTAMPDCLLQLPRLAWLALAGNAFNSSDSVSGISLPCVSAADVVLSDVLGAGASGVIYRGKWVNAPQSLADNSADIAVKLFKGEVTSDGYPADELRNCLAAGEHDNLIKVLAHIDDESRAGLVMAMIPESFRNLGLPPSLISCSRDTFADGTMFAVKSIAQIAVQIVDVLLHLQAQQINHGDLYAHNIMLDDEAKVLLGDFGAATDLSALSSEHRLQISKIECRAFACLMEDLLDLSAIDDEPVLRAALIDIKQQCMQADVAARPDFISLQVQLQAINRA